jgi:type I restriction enzyme S subunit
MSNAILSIQPIYAEAIFQGTKTIEFRRTRYQKDIERIYIYSSAPTKMILGYFTIKEVIKETPEKLWEEFNEVGGIAEGPFFEYFIETTIGFGIIFDKVVAFENPLDPIDFIKDFHGRGTYIYLH